MEGGEEVELGWLLWFRAQLGASHVNINATRTRGKVQHEANQSLASTIPSSKIF